MTPLAHAIAVDNTLPLAARKYGALAQDIGLFDGLHFFEVSDVLPLLSEIGPKLIRGFSHGQQHLAFLPAPRVLIEWRSSVAGAWRDALLIEAPNGEIASLRSVIMLDSGQIHTTGTLARFPLNAHPDLLDCQIKVRQDLPDETKSYARGMVANAYTFLAMINTPRVIGRRQHMPHAGLQRKLAASKGVVGRFPLRAWTEMRLEVRPPRDESGSAPRQGWLTGERCLHFCRAHLRVWGGRLVQVSAHWRGNGALGIKQTRYAVVPQKKAA